VIPAIALLHFSPVLLCSTALAPPPDVQLERPVPKRKTGGNFQQALSDRVTMEWQNVPLRKVLRSLSQTQGISFLLDRRIDPTQKPKLQLKRVSLMDAVNAIAKAAGGRAVVVGNVVYIGPEKPAALLIPLLTQRAAELRRLSQTLQADQRRRLARKATVHWNDLDRPREILKTIGETFGLTVSGLEQIPHDLWASATLPAVSRTQALSLILIQFDSTFRWKPKAAGVEIVPIPDDAKRQDAPDSKSKSRKASS